MSNWHSLVRRNGEGGERDGRWNGDGVDAEGQRDGVGGCVRFRVDEEALLLCVRVQCR